jgi:hypothetical protein
VNRIACAAIDVEDSGHGGAKETQSTRDATRQRTMLENAWQRCDDKRGRSARSWLGALSIDVDALMRDDKIRY